MLPIVTVTLQYGESESGLAQRVEQELQQMLARHRFDLKLISAGYRPAKTGEPDLSELHTSLYHASPLGFDGTTPIDTRAVQLEIATTIAEAFKR